MKNKLIMLSGGQDSVAVAMEIITRFGVENVKALGFHYGQKHFAKESIAARNFCNHYGINSYEVLNIPINQINKGRCLTDKNVDITTDMNKQRDTVVHFRNGIFMLFAAGYAIQNNCDTIFCGMNAMDFTAYRDCRPIFFKFLQQTIQAGLTQPEIGSENMESDLVNSFAPDSKLDIKIEIPLQMETKRTTVKRIVTKYGIEPYKYSYTCYKGGDLQCGLCCSCIERIDSFKFNGYEDPIPYAIKIDWK